ncbi:Tyrosinase-like protein orsC [Fusarium oxysporum f. sp. cubense]|uniref:Tyrosinase-like protein orsC n=1 Tax=Fusarium oxysporum f. sp. cubense TaxID=61366 RepID=A0A559KNA8_FUSOC|nr:Tyrosinase-like protein orsC [Fusarium oxysporum f. sp. cubense]
MQISFGILAALLSASSLVAASPTQSAGDLMLDLNSKATSALENAQAPTSRKKCTIANANVRRDWKALSKKERKAYINAVLCLRKKPSKADPSFAPGARTRYDDFVAVHINQTRTIHATGNFFTWHRYYTWAYEKALRDECGYRGTQPYWNWFETGDFATNPLFDGSETSMSGDGEFFKHNGSVSGTGLIFLPSGNGGGCIKKGPFAGATANLGPPSPGMDGMEATATPLEYNPRCLRRDLSRYTIDKWMTLPNLYNVTLGDASRSIQIMQDEFQGRFPDRFLGLHGAGHFAIGGDSSDLYSSSNEPVFFLHHAMVDRVYWIWQALHPKQARDIAGTITIGNRPPSRDALKSDPLNMGVNAAEITIDDALDTMSGSPFCYIYLQRLNIPDISTIVLSQVKVTPQAVQIPDYLPSKAPSNVSSACSCLIASPSAPMTTTITAKASRTVTTTQTRTNTFSVNKLRSTFVTDRKISTSTSSSKTTKTGSETVTQTNRKSTMVTKPVTVTVTNFNTVIVTNTNVVEATNYNTLYFTNVDTVAETDYNTVVFTNTEGFTVTQYYTTVQIDVATSVITPDAVTVTSGTTTVWGS